MEILQGIDAGLSPINPEPHLHRLPAELLQQIFLLVVHNLNGSDYPSIFSFEYTASPREYVIYANFVAPPLLFTRVCRLWRAVACSTTELWSHVQVILPGGIKPLGQFLPSVLQFWLARSGNQPLTLCIDSRPLIVKCGRRFRRLPDSEGNSQLLEILLAERGRWDMVTFASSIREWEVKLDTLDTPKLRNLECDISDLKMFNAPNLSRLRIKGFAYVPAVLAGPTPTTTNIRYLHLDYASVHAICSTAVIFPHLQTLIVDRLFPPSENPLATRTCLNIQSMTLSIFEYPYMIRPKFMALFESLQLPMLQKLTLAGELRKAEVALVMSTLAATPCHPQVIDFQTPMPLNEVDPAIAEPLLSFVEEVTVHGEVLCRRA
ncbi:hypothetical protein K503DRAFT_371109 [Rhizopogon vinicolor AM-OR11-026]|uniref:Uncharacterized protein n=1 Tax=Rhizopogon vinicolor AM-OR11-026 TaxID=1314800 RepID=A0A1B7MS26_9AGAM|nr:hypothetical protein K503DRAFT_371109 [Rhizopogon vinicolor AM-OR11-026]